MKDDSSELPAKSENPPPAPEPVQPDAPKGRKLVVKDLILAFVVPTLFGKVLILYFGINYSAQPDRGYGVGLILSILFTMTMIGRFLWRYRHYDDS